MRGGKICSLKGCLKWGRAGEGRGQGLRKRLGGFLENFESGGVMVDTEKKNQKIPVARSKFCEGNLGEGG